MRKENPKKIETIKNVTLITKVELAKNLSLSVSMIDKLLASGLPHYKIGKSVRFDIQQVLLAFNQRFEKVKRIEDNATIKEEFPSQHKFNNKNDESSPKVREVVDIWKRENWPHLKTNTRLQYARCIDFIEPLNNRPIETIRASDIDQLIAHWKGRYIKSQQRSSFIKEFDVIKLLFLWYQRNFDNAKLTLPFKDRHKKQILVKQNLKIVRRFMTEQETKIFLIALREEGELFYTIGAIQIMQLLRISEVLAMKWSNLDVKNKQYHLCEHVVWERIGGVKPKIEPGTKTVKPGEVYTINLFQEGINLLEKLGKEKRCDLIFHQDCKILTYRQIQYRFDNAFKRSGLPFRATHVLRHTGATRFYNLSGDILALQHMGTWADSRMAQHYAKISSSRARDAISILECKQSLLLE